MTTSITTNRLLIKPLAPDDASFILELVNSPGWLAFIGDRNVHSQEDAINYIQKISDNPNINYFVVRSRDNNTPIGVVSFIKRAYLQHHDIGFAFLPSSAGNGYAYEATKAVLNNIAQTGQHSRILATTLAANDKSIKLLIKLGLEFDQEIDLENEKVQVYAVPADKLIE